MALALKVRVVLGMRLAVYVGGQQLIEGMHPKSGGKHLLGLLHPIPKLVDRVLTGRIAPGLAVAEGWILEGGDNG